MISKPIIEEKKIEKTIETKPKEAFMGWTSLKHWEDFTLKIGRTSREGLNFWGQKKMHSLNVTFKQA
jgi:hypothetical protein